MSKVSERMKGGSLERALSCQRLLTIQLQIGVLQMHQPECWGQVVGGWGGASLRRQPLNCDLMEQ